MVSYLKVKSPQTPNDILAKCKQMGLAATLLNPKAVYSHMQLDAAYELAIQTIGEKTAISERIEIEFLLWLAQTVHVQKAIEKVGATQNEEMLFVVLGDEGDGAKITDIAIRLGLAPSEAQEIANEPALEYWGIRKDEEFDSDLAIIEQMALSRLND